MMKFRFLWILMVLAFAKALPVQAQQIKKEQESRIESQEFPAETEKWVKALSENCKKLKFYKEVDGDKTSYELKCKCEGRKRSIEFSEKGALEDVEILTRNKKVAKAVLKRIQKSLDSITSKNRIEKIQEQYFLNSTSPAQLKLRINNSDLNGYELIVAFKEKRKIYRKELQFDRYGKLISSRDIKRLEYDFLLF
ncbi:hypothetical protein BST97_09760 [Nonlabens spongiae]|uniref:Outer membrane lipoprotein carrier protein LolA n=2 Tax=Nonlabens spongiae TaxID=331648 RepID=A0A1W6MKZ2_9FLAO|nr:hypothetical protein BST97_09760 [Nonlabens spongiae]